MHTEGLKRKFFKIIFCICLVVIFFTNVAFSQKNTINLIRNYLGEIKTLQAKFSQTDNTGDIMTGELFIKKPGKIRFSYDAPHYLQIVSKQQAVLIFDPKNRGSGPLTYPLSYTPLGFLIKNDLSSLIKENGEGFELDDLIILKIQNPQYRLRIEFNKNPMYILGWEYKNQMGEVIKITLKNIRKNDYMSDEIFKTEKDYEQFKK